MCAQQHPDQLRYEPCHVTQHATVSQYGQSVGQSGNNNPHNNCPLHHTHLFLHPIYRPAFLPLRMVVPSHTSVGLSLYEPLISYLAVRATTTTTHVQATSLIQSMSHSDLVWAATSQSGAKSIGPEVPLVQKPPVVSLAMRGQKCPWLNSGQFCGSDTLERAQQSQTLPFNGQVLYTLQRVQQSHTPPFNGQVFYTLKRVQPVSYTLTTGSAIHTLQRVSVLLLPLSGKSVAALLACTASSVHACSVSLLQLSSLLGSCSAAAHLHRLLLARSSVAIDSACGLVLLGSRQVPARSAPQQDRAGRFPPTGCTGSQQGASQYTGCITGCSSITHHHHTTSSPSQHHICRMQPLPPASVFCHAAQHPPKHPTQLQLPLRFLPSAAPAPNRSELCLSQHLPHSSHSSAACLQISQPSSTVSHVSRQPLTPLPVCPVVALCIPACLHVACCCLVHPCCMLGKDDGMAT
jgi:hypothetical protein